MNQWANTDILTFVPNFKDEDFMNEDWVNFSKDCLSFYIESFTDLTVEQNKNFQIKKEHSHRVAEIINWLSQKLKLSDEDKKNAFLCGIFHDIGRFSQLVKYNTFNDSKSVDHAEYSVEILKNKSILDKLECSDLEAVYYAIQWHNKFGLPEKTEDKKLLLAQILRDADKLDILKVITDYYSQRNSEPNHTLTWELPKGTKVSEAVAKNALAGKLVQKKDVVSEMDIKIMQLSWVFDLNFKFSVEYILEKRFLEKIFDSLPKNDLVIDVYRKIKVFAENKLLK